MHVMAQQQIVHNVHKDIIWIYPHHIHVPDVQQDVYHVIILIFAFNVIMECIRNQMEHVNYVLFHA